MLTDAESPYKNKIPHLLDLITANLLLLPRRLSTFWCLTAVLVLMLTSGEAAISDTPAYAADNDEKASRVLYLNSYNRGYKWSDDIERGLLERFQSADRKVELSVEFLDSRRFPDTTRFDSLAETLAAKYAGYRHDLVLVSDNFAFDLATRYRKQLFPDLPIVFCGYNNFRPEVIKRIGNITGVNEEVDIAKTVELAIKVQPSLRTLAFIISTRDTSSKLIAKIAESSVIPKYRDRYNVIVLKDAPMSEIKSRLGALASDSAVILVGQTSDRKEGRELTPEENGRIISTASPVPVYSFWDFHIGTGVLGGHIITGVEQGRTAGDMALRILGGAHADSIPVMMQTPATDIFDFNAMERHGIAADKLPATSFIVNRQDTAWAKYRLIILGTIGFILLMCVVIATLTVNILKRKRAEEELRKLSQAVEQSPASIAITDLLGNIEYVNPAFCVMTGFTKEELIGKNPRVLKSGFTSEDEYRKLWATITEGGTWTGEFCNKRKNGELFWERSCIAPIKDNRGAIRFFVAIKEDITRQKLAEKENSRLESELHQAQKMESIGRLAGGVAHDFNNILTVIHGYSSLGLMELDPQQKTFGQFEQIRNAAERAAELTHQLLAFARKQTIAPKVIDLNLSVAGMLKMLQRLIGEEVQLKWQQCEKLWNVKMDPSQVDQILANLCVNARDAVSDAGTVIIKVENCSLDESHCAKHTYSEPGEYVLLSVIDNGCGMDEETVTHIFEPFFTTKGLGEGTGLGLSTVYGIVKQNGGFIEVSSQLAMGTTFKIYLPRHVGVEEQAEQGDAEKSAPRGNETILLIEDDIPILNFAKTILEKLGYTVVAESSPSKAIHLAGENADKIHLLVTDIVMPEMNGRELASSLQSIYPHMKSLFMSGYTSEVVERHGVLSSDFNFIQKPFTMHSMATKVREVLDSK
jgi:PAS domain S-box-containing protein